jgi:hypothetical protein
MTTISGTAAQTRPANRFLRVVLRVDSIASGLTGIAFLGTQEVFENLYGLPPAVTVPTGVLLLVWAAGVWLASSPSTLNAVAVIAIIALNVVWVATTVVTLAAGLLPLTTQGVGLVIVLAAAVAVLAELEFIGLRRIGK